jgi:hypothetical protein
MGGGRRGRIGGLRGRRELSFWRIQKELVEKVSSVFFFSFFGPLPSFYPSLHSLS